MTKAPKPTVIPYGIFLPEWDELFLYCTTSKVTSDFMVDVLEAWWLEHRGRLRAVQTLLLNQDNGPENNGRRTQFMKRMVDFAVAASGESPIGLLSARSCVNTIPLSGLGAFWKITLYGNILDEIDTVLQFARSMTWNGHHPVVKLVTQTYQTRDG